MFRALGSEFRYHSQKVSGDHCDVWDQFSLQGKSSPYTLFTHLFPQLLKSGLWPQVG